MVMPRTYSAVMTRRSPAAVLCVVLLAGGCAVGAGVSGGSVLVITAWVALFCMWISAGLTDFLVDRRADEANAACETAKRESELSAESGPRLAKSSDLVQPN